MGLWRGILGLSAAESRSQYVPSSPLVKVGYRLGKPVESSRERPSRVTTGGRKSSILGRSERSPHSQALRARR